MPRAHQYSAWLLYLLICAVYLTLATSYPALYVRMTYEDLYGEWLQTWLFALVFLLALPLAERQPAYRWFFTLLALAGFYVVMEEISWGQRLFAIESPEFFAENNVQGETNLHNFLTGPKSTLLKDIVEYTLAAALIGYGLVYPLLLRLGSGLACRVNRLGVAPPPLYLWMFFVNAACFEIGWFKFNEAEIAEILVGTALVLMLLQYRIVGEPATDTGAPVKLSAADSARCGRMYLTVFAMLIALAWGTTTVFYSLPGRAAGIDARLANGYEKFAERMEESERWHDAAELYRHGFELGPQYLPMLHQALANYQAAGDADRYRQYYRIMLDATADEVLMNDPSVENLLMLASEYAGIEAQTTGREYLDRALGAAIDQVAELPGNSDGHYWLGRVHQQRGDLVEARLAYQQALSIEPGRSRTIFALRALQGQIDKSAEPRREN